MAWLNDVPDASDPPMAGQPASGDAVNFFGAPKEETVSGPRKLYRLAGAKGRKAPQFGNWWFDEGLLQMLADDVIGAAYGGERQKNASVLLGTRSSLAVFEKWSHMGWFCELALNAGQELRAFVGKAEQMLPEEHGMPRGPGNWGGLLTGGGLQYLIYGLETLNAKKVVQFSKIPTQTFLDRLTRSPGYRGVINI